MEWIRKCFIFIVIFAFIVLSAPAVYAKGGGGGGGGGRGGGSSFSGGGGKSFTGGGMSGFSTSRPPSSSPKIGESGKTFGGSNTGSVSSPALPRGVQSNTFTNSDRKSVSGVEKKTGSSFAIGGASMPDRSVSSPAPSSRLNTSSTIGGNKVYGPVSSQYSTGVRNVVIVRHYYDAPVGWRSPYYPIGYNPSPSLLQMWYNIQILNSISDMNERNRRMMELKTDPDYDKWRSEALRLSSENQELKKQIQDLDDTQVTSNFLSEASSSTEHSKKFPHFWFWIFIVFVVLLTICWYYKAKHLR